MAIFYLLAAIIGSSSIVIFLKIFEIKGVNMIVGVTMNNIAAAVLAFAFAPRLIGVGDILSAPWLWIALVIGAMFMLSCLVYGWSAQRTGVAVTTISGRAAVVIPVVFAFAAYGETVTPLKVAMLALILAAMAMILWRKAPEGEGRRNMDIWLVLLPVMVFLYNGFNDSLVQYAQRDKLPAGDSDIYHIFVGTLFVGGSITGLVCCAVECLRKGRFRIPKAKEFGWGSLMGLLNWVCMIGTFYALSYLDGSVFYPLYYTGAIVISTIVGVWAFKERLSPLNWTGVAIAVAAIAVLSFLQ